MNQRSGMPTCTKRVLLEHDLKMGCTAAWATFAGGRFPPPNPVQLPTSTLPRTGREPNLI